MTLTSKKPMKRTPFRTARPTGVLAQASFAKVRAKKCAICREPFTPARPSALVCSPKCAEQHAVALRAKAERKADKARKDALRPRSYFAEAAQKAFNRYVNQRDREADCVSCGKPAARGGVRNASHFKSVGSNSAMRFHLWNVHSSCYRCNVELSGNLGEYYPRLIGRIGAAKVEYLQNAKRERRYEVEYLERLKTIFNRKAKRLAARK
ncbi:MAG: bacteriophage Lambda NinG protein [Massilia sp.]|nr:bacteriophage Lambda NinG protein [Massilia sp.]